MILDIRTTADIHATPQAVWQVLIDLAAYPEWNPFITSAKGTVEVGERLRLRLEPPGGVARTIRPLVTEADAGHELRWVEEGWVPGALDGHHAFSIISKGENRTHVVHRETFTGILVFFLRAYLETQIRQGLEAMNRALKARAQGGKGPGL